MSRKKKKISGQQKQKLAAAQYKNEFLRKFRSIFSVFCGDKLFRQIPPHIIEMIYRFRSHYINLIPTEGKYITHAVLERFKSDFTMFHRKEKFALDDTNVEISIYDVLTVGFTLLLFEYLIKDEDFPAVEEIRNGLEKIKLERVFDEEIRMRLYVTFRSVALWHNDIEKCQYWFNYKPEFDSDKIGYFHKVYVHSSLPEITSVVVDNIARPAIFFQWAQPLTGLEDVYIKPSSLNIKGPFADIPMRVCIQKHALQRFAERIDCINIGFAQYFIYISFIELNVFYDTHNNLLIEYRYADKRAGYFRVDIVEGVILVRTFLFVTNNSTPEGQLLEKNTGLQKLDKKYLAMDKLSSFMTSDIGENKALLKILDDAGCHCLIELYEIIEGTFTDEGKCISESLLVDYLNKESSIEAEDVYS